MFSQESAPTPHHFTAPLRRELAVAHIAMMRTAAASDRMLDRAAAANDPDTREKAGRAALSLAYLSARMMQRFTEGALALRDLEGRGLSPALPALDPAATAPAPDRSPVPAAAPRPRLYAAPGLPRGRLNNGNPSGDYLVARRCGARARCGHPCGQPAMRNGRCRFHGGKSTGARTPQGLARCRAARLVHGGRARHLIELRSFACHSARRLHGLVRLARGGRPRPAGHGVDRSDSDARRQMPDARCQMSDDLDRGSKRLPCDASSPPQGVRHLEPGI
jgi:hypothetical protein